MNSGALARIASIYPVTLTCLIVTQGTAFADTTLDGSRRASQTAISGSYTVSETGVINVGNNASNALVIASATDVTNNGSILGATSSAVFNGGYVTGNIVNNGKLEAGNYGIYNFGSVSGDIKNTGEIKTTLTTSAGIYTSEILIGSIVNDGSIVSSGLGIDAAGTVSGSLINNGNITAQYEGMGTNATVEGSIVNNGSINSYLSGLFSSSSFGAAVVRGDLVNRGTITSGTKAIYNSGAIDGSLINSGTASGPIAIQNIGTITGGVINSGVLDGTVSLGTADLTITGNSARITGLLTSTGAVSVEGNFAAEADASVGNLSVDHGANFSIGSGRIWSATGTEVKSGVLSVDGQLDSSVTVDDGATLAGIGKVGSTIVNSGGTITPGGNGIGTLSVDGDLAFASGARYSVNVDPNGSSDLIHSTGTATLNDNNVISVEPNGGWSQSTTYTILTADRGVTGTFNSAVASNLAFLVPTLSYDASNVFLTLNRNDTSFSSLATNTNQGNTAAAVEAQGLGTPLYDAIVQSGAATARRAFDQLSGEAHASARGALLDDSRFLREGIARQGSRDQPYSFWIDGSSQQRRVDGDGNASSAHGNSNGVMVGGDMDIGNGLRAGAVVGSNHMTQQIDGLDSSTKADGMHYGLYVLGEWDALSLNAGISHSKYDVDTSRSVAFTGYNDSLGSKHDATADSVFAQAGYRWVFGTTTLRPYLGLARTRLNSDGFNERGGNAALSVAGQDDVVTTSTLGVKTNWDLNSGQQVQTRLLTNIGWEHSWGDTDTSSKQTLGNQSFKVYGLPLARDAAVVDLALNMKVSTNSQVQLGYRGRYGDGLSESGANVQWRFNF